MIWGQVKVKLDWFAYSTGMKEDEEAVIRWAVVFVYLCLYMYLYLHLCGLLIPLVWKRMKKCHKESWYPNRQRHGDDGDHGDDDCDDAVGVDEELVDDDVLADVFVERVAQGWERPHLTKLATGEQKD